VSGSVKVTDKVKVGGSYVKSNNPLTQDQLASVNTVVKFANDKGKFIAEFARSENINDDLNSSTSGNVKPDATGKLSGDAARVELNYSYKDLEMKVYHNQADREFYNTAAPITAGRKESGIKGRVQLNKIGLAKLEAIRTEDQLSGVNQGVSASIERAINRILAVELGLKYYDESSNPATLNTTQVAPYHGVTVRSKLISQLPWQGSNVFAEYEQDISEADRRIFALGANYQINSKLRAYARHELVSSINGLYDLNSNQRRNVTVFGLIVNITIMEQPSVNIVFGMVLVRERLRQQLVYVIVGNLKKVFMPIRVLSKLNHYQMPITQILIAQQHL
jgi:hypothetical protein